MWELLAGMCACMQTALAPFKITTPQEAPVGELAVRFQQNRR